MNHGIDTFEGARIELTALRIPLHVLSARLGRATADANDLVPAGGQKRRELRADEATRAGDGDAQARPIGELGMPRQVAKHDGVSIREDPRQRALRVSARNGTPQAAKRKFVADMVVERARLGIDRREAVRMLPGGKRTIAHDIAELAVREVIPMLEGPGGRDWAGVHLQHHLGPIANASRVLEHLGAVPRR